MGGWIEGWMDGCMDGDREAPGTKGFIQNSPQILAPLPEISPSAKG